MDAGLLAATKSPAQPRQFALASALRNECQREGLLAELVELICKKFELSGGRSERSQRSPRTNESEFACPLRARRLG
jgi:hypothetical protein